MGEAMPATAEQVSTHSMNGAKQWQCAACTECEDDGMNDNREERGRTHDDVRSERRRGNDTGQNSAEPGGNSECGRCDDEVMAEIDALIEDDIAEQEGAGDRGGQEGLWDEWEEEMAEGAVRRGEEREEEGAGDEWARVALDEDQRREAAEASERNSGSGQGGEKRDPGKRRKTTACAMFEPSEWARMSRAIGKRGETADVTGD